MTRPVSIDTILVKSEFVQITQLLFKCIHPQFIFMDDSRVGRGERENQFVLNTDQILNSSLTRATESFPQFGGDQLAHGAENPLVRVLP
jgi:hypothetical protein